MNFGLKGAATQGFKMQKGEWGEMKLPSGATMDPRELERFSKHQAKIFLADEIFEESS